MQPMKYTTHAVLSYEELWGFSNPSPHDCALRKVRKILDIHKEGKN